MAPTVGTTSSSSSVGGRPLCREHPHLTLHCHGCIFLLLSVLSLLNNVYCSPSEFFECEYELRCPGPHKKKNSNPWSGFQFYACFEFHALSGSAMMGCLVPRRECPCQAERRAREEAIKEQAAFLNKEQNNKEEEAEKQEESRRNRLFGFGLLRNLQSLFGSNLNLGSVNSSNGQPKGKRGSYRALAQDEETPTVAAASSDLEDSATSPGSMASASISSGSRMSTTGTESPVVVASRLPTIVSLRLDCWARCWPLSLF